MHEKAAMAVRQYLGMIRSESDHTQASAHYYETVGMLRGLYYGEVIDSSEMVALTQLAGSAYIYAGKPW